MAVKSESLVIILFEDEVRAAAKALAAFQGLPAEADDEVRMEHVIQALQACHAALYGADQEHAVLLLGRKAAITNGVTE